jgi:hypothetical protein
MVAYCRREPKEGARAIGGAQPPPILPSCAMLVFVEIAILLKPIGKVNTCHWLTNCLVFSFV